MRFDIITIFPKIFDSYFNESMIRRARAKKLVDIKIHDLRKFSRDSYKKVDDRPYGGGPGMVIKIEPIARAIGSILKIKNQNSPPRRIQGLRPLNAKTLAFNSKIKNRVRIILFSASGKQFTQKMARDWARNYDRVIMIAGHYEGVDERIKKVIENWKLKIENLSVGPYVLTGGELPAMVVLDAVSRHIPGVLGKEESLEEKRHGVGVPVFTRPETFLWKGQKYRMPKVLLSGDHKKIEAWRRKKGRSC